MTSAVASSIIQKAYQNAGKIPRGGTPTSAQQTDALSTLYDVIAFEVTKGLKLWLQSESAVTLTSGQGTYSFYPSGNITITKPLRILDVVYVDSSGATRPLVIISRDEWLRTTNRSQTGSVNQAFVEKLYDRLNLNLWYVPDTSAALGSVRVTVAGQATLPSSLSDTIAFPPEWGLFWQWRLGQELATGMPQEIIARCDQMVGVYRESLEGFDVEEAPTYFTVDTQGETGSGFR
jgi:hypothetical protein